MSEPDNSASAGNAVPGARWRSDVVLWARRLSEGVALARACVDNQPKPGDPSFEAWAKVVTDEIDKALAAAAPAPWRRRLRQWLSGSAYGTAWRAVHGAEAALVMIEPAASLQGRLQEIEASVATILGSSDGRTAGYLADLKNMVADKDAGQCRDKLRAITGAVNETADNARSNLRSYRNWLFGISVIVVVVLAVVAVAHAADKTFITIPVSGTNADVGQLELAGAVGGLLTALFSLVRLQVYSGPFNLPFWQALIRIPAGAAAALVGATFLQGQLLSAFKPVTSTSGLFAYAVFFGAAPEIILQFLDKQVNKASDAARSKNDPLRDVPKQS